MLARSIKSRLHPELNLINRYMLDVTVRSSSIFARVPEEADEDDDHPLVALGAVNSTLLRSVQEVVWRKFSRSNSRQRHYHRGDAHLKDRVLSRMVGRLVIQRNLRKSDADWKVFFTTIPIQVGPWKFTSVPEDWRFEPGTCHAYFAIRQRNIPTLLDWYETAREQGWHLTPDERYRPDELIYGMIHELIQIQVPNWREGDRVISLARATCWRGDRQVGLSGLTEIDRRKPIKLTQPGDEPNIKLEFIPLQHIETQVMMAPVVTGWKDKSHRPKDKENIDPVVSEHRFFAIPLQI
jgi:hypothetical protein